MSKLRISRKSRHINHHCNYTRGKSCWIIKEGMTTWDNQELLDEVAMVLGNYILFIYLFMYLCIYLFIYLINLFFIGVQFANI